MVEVEFYYYIQSYHECYKLDSKIDCLMHFPPNLVSWHNRHIVPGVYPIQRINLITDRSKAHNSINRMNLIEYAL